MNYERFGMKIAALIQIYLDSKEGRKDFILSDSDLIQVILKMYHDEEKEED